MTQSTDNFIDRMVRAIVDEVDPEQVILFGSRGRGDERRDSDEIPDEVFGFHVQQAAEKSPKAHLALLGETYPLTQNLEALLDMLAKRSIATASFRQLIGYTPFAVEFRFKDVGSDTEATFTAYENIIKLCIDEHVDALLIAGDAYASGDRSLLGYFEVGHPSADCSYSALPRR